MARAVVIGTVVGCSGPTYEKQMSDPWTRAANLLFAVALLPILVILALIAACLSVAAHILGRGRTSVGGRGGTLRRTLVHRLLNRFTSQSNQISVYDYAIDSSGRAIHARIIGTLTTGAIFPHQHVRLEGSFRGGVFYVDRGVNNTLSIPIEIDRPSGKVLFFVAAILVTLEVGLFITLGNR